MDISSPAASFAAPHAWHLTVCGEIVVRMVHCTTKLAASLQTNLFIVGAQKAGTTALHSYLSRHPDIQMSTRKELHFFDNERLDWSNPNYSLFESSFPETGRVVRGEATPIYLYWPNSIERLKAYDPSARLIVMLRHPTFRAFSHWKMETVRGVESLSFDEAISDVGRERVRNAPLGVHRNFSYVERGFYASQIERLLKIFPRNQILFICTDDLWIETGNTIEKIEEFLCLDKRISAKKEYIILASTKIPEDLSLRSREYLDELYAPQIRSASTLSGLDLSQWLSPTYQEPTKMGA